MGYVYGTSAQVLKTTARFRHRTNLRYTEGKGVRPGPFSIYSAGVRNDGPFLKVAFWLNQLSAGALNCLSLYTLLGNSALRVVMISFAISREKLRISPAVGGADIE